MSFRDRYRSFRRRCNTLTQAGLTFLIRCGKSFYRRPFGGVTMVILAGVFTLIFYISPPAHFPIHEKVTIPDGSSLRQTALILKEHSVIHSPLVFQVLVHYLNAETGIRAGVYMFPEKLSVFEVAHALVSADYQIPPYRITVFEGMRVEQIAEILANENNIDYDHFIKIAKPYEGYLFPDTYFIPDAYTAEDILQLMLDTFQKKIGPLQKQIDDSGLSFKDVVILASILEREARSEESMRTVAGILLKRLSINMPLQVDAAFEYTLNKSSVSLSLVDLSIDSPYNTYTNKGLPPTPISNPGLTAIEAVLNPIKTDYLYYLTAHDGTFHYAKTFEEHKRNKALYL